MEEQLVELDERRRASLGKIGRPEHRRYLATEQADGTITLTPAVVMTEMEAKFLADRELVERIEQNRRHPARLVQRSMSPPQVEESSAAG